MDQEFANQVKLEWEMEQMSMNMSKNDTIYAQLTELRNQNQQILERITRAETKIENMSNGGGAGSLINIEDIINDPEEFAKRFFFTFMPKTDNVIYDKTLGVYVPQQIGLYINYNGPELSRQFISLNNLRDFVTDINKSELVNINLYVLTKTKYAEKETFTDFSDDKPTEQLELTDDLPDVNITDINNSTDEQILINLNQNTDENIYDWIYFELCVEIKIIDELTKDETINKYYVDFKTTDFKIGNIEDYNPEQEPEPEPEPDPEPEPEPENGSLIEMYVNYHSKIISMGTINKISYRGFQFDIIVPNEMTIENNSITLTHRCDNFGENPCSYNEIDYDDQSYKKYRILFSEPSENTIDVGSGDILYITVNNTPNASFSITINNIVFAWTDLSTPSTVGEAILDDIILNVDN